MELLNGTMHFLFCYGQYLHKVDVAETLSFEKTITYKFADKIS